VGTQSEGIGVLYAADSSLTATPSAYGVTRGTWIAGTVSSMASSDDDALWIDSAASGTRLLSMTSIDIPTPVADPATMTISVELSTDGITTATFSVRNVVTGAWDAVGAATRLSASDQTVALTVSNPADHVVTRTGLVRLRVSTRAAAAPNPGGVAVGFDHVEMTVTE